MADDVACLGADVSDRDVVVFDFDGTLADTKKAIVQVATKVLLEWGLPQDQLGDVGRLVGPPFPQAFSYVYGLSARDAEKVTEAYRAIYSKMGPEAWPLFEGMDALLDDLRSAGRRLAVASSKRSQLLVRGLSENGILPLFELALGKPDDDREMTKAQTLSEVLGRLGASPDDAVMVGDRFYDVEGALACGVPCVGVEFGHTAAPGELAEAGACAVVESMDGLRKVLLG